MNVHMLKVNGVLYNEINICCGNFTLRGYQTFTPLNHPDC